MSNKAEKEPGFEESLKRLESLVEAMEEGEVPLADLVEKFEEGTKLIQSCEVRLQAAELKIEKLRESQEGSELEALGPESGDES